MNERIRKLMEQIEIFENQYTAEKFALLIVRECIDCLKPLSRNHSMVGAAQDTIREHFGVQE